MTWHDLRDWMDEVDKAGELRVVSGADWQEDIGRITEMLDHTPDSPCVVFDDIPGYPSGWRVISNCNAHRNGDSGVYPGSAADVNATSSTTATGISKATPKAKNSVITKSR